MNSAQIKMRVLRYVSILRVLRYVSILAWAVVAFLSAVTMRNATDIDSMFVVACLAFVLSNYVLSGYATEEK